MTHGKKPGMTRREFLRDTSVAALGGSLLLGAPGTLLAGPGGSPAAGLAKRAMSDVVLIRDPDVLDGEGEPRPAVVLAMLDAAVARLTGKKEAADGWRTLISSDDVVGIKTNVWSPIGTTAAVEQALRTRVLAAGVAASDVAISDRGVRDDPVFRRATALINARPMRTHHWAGVGSLIKNYIMFVPDPFHYHDDACARLGEIWTHPGVAGKTRLNVLVMFTPQFHTVGPHGFSPRHVARYHGLIVGRDPVAVDTIGLQIIQGLRDEHFGEPRPLSPPATHIAVAGARYGLGNADRERINLVKLGYDQRSHC